MEMKICRVSIQSGTGPRDTKLFLRALHHNYSVSSIILPLDVHYDFNNNHGNTLLRLLQSEKSCAFKPRSFYLFQDALGKNWD